MSVERRLAYEEGIRIPLLVRYPKLVKPGGLFDEFALSIDLAPTLLDLAQATSTFAMDGRSLVPLLKGEHPADRRTSFLIQYKTDTVFPRVHKMGYHAIRTQRWKYIRYNKLDDMDELFDLKHDPYEPALPFGCDRAGTCNIEARRIWLNLELAKKPPVCLEYILVEVVQFKSSPSRAREGREERAGRVLSGGLVGAGLRPTVTTPAFS